MPAIATDPSPFDTLLDLREQKKKTSDVDPDALFASYLKQIDAVVAYVDRLEKKVVIEEDTVNDALAILRKANLRELSVQLNGDTLVLTGKIAHDKQAPLQGAMAEMERIPGVHAVKNSVIELEPERPPTQSGRNDAGHIFARDHGDTAGPGIGRSSAAPGTPRPNARRAAIPRPIERRDLATPR